MSGESSPTESLFDGESCRDHETYRDYCPACRHFASSGIARSPEDEPVGVGPLYETMRSEAAKLVHLFAPAGVANSQSYWGAGICGVIRGEDGTNRVSVSTLGRERRAMVVEWDESIERLRAAAISLLVYCEAHGG